MKATVNEDLTAAIRRLASPEWEGPADSISYDLAVAELLIAIREREDPNEAAASVAKMVTA
jgi:hypothetical protein